MFARSPRRPAMGRLRAPRTAMRQPGAEVSGAGKRRRTLGTGGGLYAVPGRKIDGRSPRQDRALCRYLRGAASPFARLRPGWLLGTDADHNVGGIEYLVCGAAFGPHASEARRPPGAIG